MKAAGRPTIGTLAKLCGVGVETIRFYERQKLIEQPSRPAHGYRSYAPETVERVLFIRKAKALGFSLEDIRVLLSLRTDRGRSCNLVRDKALTKIAAVEEKVKDLMRLRSALEDLVRVCDGRGTVDGCRILQALSTSTEQNIIIPPQTKEHPWRPPRAAKPTAKDASKRASAASRNV